MVLERGATFAGARVEEQLGEGALGVHARGIAHGRSVGVHALHSGVSPEDRRRFSHALRRLVEVTRKERPAGILAPLGIDDRFAGFSTRLATSGTLEDLPTLKWTLARKLEIVAKTAEVVEWLHHRKLVHGALSPAAVLLDDDLDPWICGVDGVHLALGTAADSSAPEALELYSAPEALAGDPVDARCDVYSLGRILQFLLGSRHPAGLGSALKPSDLPDAPAALVHVVRRATWPEAQDRHPDLESFLLDLAKLRTREGATEDAGADAPTPRPPSLLPPRFDRRSRRPPGGSTRPPAMPDRAGERQRDLAPRTRAVLAMLGALSVAASLGVAWLEATSASIIEAASLGSWIGGALVALLLPAGPRAPLVHRALFAGLAVAALVTLDPVGTVALHGGVARLHSQSVAVRSAAARAVVERGERDLAGLDLGGTALGGLDLASASLVGTELGGADLRGADLNHADLTDAEVAEARFEGADLTDTDLEDARGVERARCDETTSLPTRAECVDGRIALAEAP